MILRLHIPGWGDLGGRSVLEIDFAQMRKRGGHVFCPNHACCFCVQPLSHVARRTVLRTRYHSVFDTPVVALNRFPQEYVISLSLAVKLADAGICTVMSVLGVKCCWWFAIVPW